MQKAATTLSRNAKALTAIILKDKERGGLTRATESTVRGRTRGTASSEEYEERLPKSEQSQTVKIAGRTVTRKESSSIKPGTFDERIRNSEGGADPSLDRAMRIQLLCASLSTKSPSSILHPRLRAGGSPNCKRETKFSACRMSKTRGALPNHLQIRFELGSFIFRQAKLARPSGISEGASQSTSKAKAMSYLGSAMPGAT